MRSSWRTPWGHRWRFASPTGDPTSSPGSFHSTAGRRRVPERLQPHLAEVRCPVRLLLGTATHEGGVSAAEVAVLAAALPAFVVDSVAGAGHFIYEEQPAVVVEAVRRMRAS